LIVIPAKAGIQAITHSDLSRHSSESWNDGDRER